MNRQVGAFRRGFAHCGRNVPTLINTALLSMVYALGVGPTALLARAAGKKFLQTDMPADAKTWWDDLDLKTRPMEEYYRQF